MCGYMFCHLIPLWVYIRNQKLPFDILNFIVNKLRNQDKKIALIWAYKFGALVKYSEIMRPCHNMNTIVQTKTSGYA